MSEEIVEPQDGSQDEPQKRIYWTRVFKEVTITPPLAAEWLGVNYKNRPEKKGGTAAYSRDVENEKWVVTGDTIKFDWFGNLIDGQHRLKAVLAADRPLTTYVIWGVDPIAQKRTDSGLSRSFRDQLALDGVKHSGPLATAARRVTMWNPPFNERVNFGHSKVTKPELEETLARHPELFHCVEFVEKIDIDLDMSPSMLAFLYWVFMHANPDAAAEFITRLAIGNVEEGDPIRALRIWVRKQKGSKARNFEGTALWKAAITWNAWMGGRTLSKIQVTKGGMKQDAFPRLRVRRSGPNGPSADDEE
jgi:hypothetical protein